MSHRPADSPHGTRSVTDATPAPVFDLGGNEEVVAGERDLVEAPRPKTKPRVAYPDEARILGVEGTVTLELEIDRGGRVRSVRVLHGLGHGLDEAAVRAVRALGFTAPRSRDGREVAARIRYRITFSLRS